jgi:hypothetical protein
VADTRSNGADESLWILHDQHPVKQGGEYADGVAVVLSARQHSFLGRVDSVWLEPVQESLPGYPIPLVLQTQQSHALAVPADARVGPKPIPKSPTSGKAGQGQLGVQVDARRWLLRQPALDVDP